MNRAASREVWVGLVVVAGLAGVIALVGLAGGGPGFLASRRSIDVVFRDGQGIRVGSPVRVAGLDVGQVAAIDLEEVEGTLRARVRLAVPADVAEKLRQDVKITIQAGLTGQGCINVVSSGRSSVALVPGQVVQGVETSFFDPILEQVGLGPVERSHLSHTIAEVRQTVDAAGPRLNQILGSLQATATGFRDTAEAIRPAIESSARRIDAALPKAEEALQRVETLMTRLDVLVAENRPNVLAATTSLRDLAATAQDVVSKDRKKVEDLLDGLNATRGRVDRVLFQADQMLGQGSGILARTRADIERTVANVRDATDYGDKLVQKIYANPFVLSPFYKPTPEDVRAQATYDTAQNFMTGARELKDAVTALEAMRAKPMSPAERQTVDQLFQRATHLESRLGEISQRLAEGLRPETTPRGRPRR